jgi:uroporphyrinogen decarboxylase
MTQSINDSLFMRTIRGESVERPPIWIMRQAGRYMAEYQAIRKEISFLDLCKDPVKATQVTMLPMDMLDVDAAIVFSDILVPLEAMGMEVVFGQGGPQITNPITCTDDVHKLRIPNPAADCPWAAETISMVTPLLGGRPCLGFAGAPFTLASYMIEGKTSKSFNRIKSMMFREPDLLHAVLEKVTEAISIYLQAQIDAGAPAVQLFDTWAGILAREDYREFALPYQQKVLAALKGSAKTVIYVNGSQGRLDLLQEAGADILSIDWRTPMGKARAVFGPDTVIQGNLDPCALYGPPEKTAQRAHRIMEEAGTSHHVFNLGHGVLPDIPVPHVQALVNTIKAYRY